MTCQKLVIASRASPHQIGIPAAPTWSWSFPTHVAGGQRNSAYLEGRIKNRKRKVEVHHIGAFSITILDGKCFIQNLVLVPNFSWIQSTWNRYQITSRKDHMKVDNLKL